MVPLARSSYVLLSLFRRRPSCSWSPNSHLKHTLPGVLLCSKKWNADSLGLVVDLSATPLLRNGLIHVEDVRGHVIQVLTTKIDGADKSKQRVLVPHHPQSHPPKFNQCNLSLVTASYLPSIMNTRYWDIRRSIRRHCPSCCFMERIFGQMSPPLMEGWTSEMSCETVQSWENLLNKFFQGARWCLWLRERSQVT